MDYDPFTQQPTPDTQNQFLPFGAQVTDNNFAQSPQYHSADAEQPPQQDFSPFQGPAEAAGFEQADRSQFRETPPLSGGQPEFGAAPYAPPIENRDVTVRSLAASTSKRFLLNIVSFLFPLIGLILFFTYRIKSPVVAKKCIIRSILGFIIMPLITILIFAMLGTALFLNSGRFDAITTPEGSTFSVRELIEEYKQHPDNYEDFGDFIETKLKEQNSEAYFEGYYSYTDGGETDSAPYSTETQPNASDQYVLVGDISGDKIIDKEDLVLLSSALSDEIPLTGGQLTAADIDEDGVLTMEDARLLMEIIRTMNRAEA